MTTKVAVPDGEFDLHVWLPEAGRGPGVLLIQEIFGVGEYIRAVAEDLAGLGYVVAAPDLFWRMEPNWTVQATPETMPQAMEAQARFDQAKGLDDLEASLAKLVEMPEVAGKVGALGFCMGGTLAYLLAARTDLDAVVSFYGSGVAGALDQIDRIGGPLLFVFGGSDPYISRESVAEVERAAETRPNIDIAVVEQGGHAFHNRTSQMFYQEEPAKEGWALAEDFLRRHLAS
ncbi:dienelactone hydrolase family protein [Actinomadura parmotrematis]|uniref:Dienelactone hydrolase family protein n=1 Tax=Actinomadura parmotrematis TaxID=2864039 RepID=A0ABS7FXN7_9ACTN|nr:dienelactone hydrolase family protein [Actinomadura parmotrematis]MBW8485203.1 dienelactone hydrolase family protein [Actinomadura parmotrematis]